MQLFLFQSKVFFCFLLLVFGFFSLFVCLFIGGPLAWCALVEKYTLYSLGLKTFSCCFQKRPIAASKAHLMK